MLNAVFWLIISNMALLAWVAALGKLENEI